MLKALSFVVSVYLAANLFASGQDCTLRLPNDIPNGTDPLMYVYEGEELKYAVPRPTEGQAAIQLKTNQELVVSCSGEKNYISVAGQQTSTAKCVSGRTLVLNDKQYEGVQLKCDKKTTPTLLNTGKPCAGANGTLVEIGYNSDGIGWHKLLETCHNIKGSHSYYSKHTLYGTAIGSRMKGHGRPKFRPGTSEFYKGITPQKSYNQKNQAAILADIVGPQNVGQYLEPKKNLFMAKGHMAPDGDFLFNSWQSASFFFINVAPQWQTINGGNWNKLEVEVRGFAQRNLVDLEVATGTYGVMTILGKELYLAKDERLQAPDLYWKVIRRPSDNSCIAFVSTNNPFLKSPPIHLCSNICPQYNWPVNYSDLREGYIYCCDYRSIKAAIPHVPDMSCKSVIAYS